MSHNKNSDRPIDYGITPPHRGEAQVDMYQPEGMDYPILERTTNALLWPEAPKGRIDLENTYEISTIPEDPATPMESVDTLKSRGVIPN